MDKVLQAAKLVWPQVSENTNILPIKRDSVIIPVLGETPAEWRAKSKPWELDELTGLLGPCPEFEQVTIKLEQHDGLDFAAGYDAKNDILVVPHGEVG